MIIAQIDWRMEREMEMGEKKRKLDKYCKRRFGNLW